MPLWLINSHFRSHLSIFAGTRVLRYGFDEALIYDVAAYVSAQVAAAETSASAGAAVGSRTSPSTATTRRSRAGAKAPAAKGTGFQGVHTEATPRGKGRARGKGKGRNRAARGKDAALDTSNEAKECNDILSRMFQLSEAAVFFEPVDGIDGYTDVVRKPMDFSTVRKKLEKGTYARPNCATWTVNGSEGGVAQYTKSSATTVRERFHNDMLMVFDNCMQVCVRFMVARFSPVPLPS